jgi:hypothetical protein
VLGLAADDGGRVVAVGWSELQEERPGLSILARYSSSGKLDKRFGPRHKRRGQKHRRALR